MLHKRSIVGLGAVLVVLVAVVGCQLFESSQMIEVAAPVENVSSVAYSTQPEGTAVLNSIILPGRITEWQMYYQPGDAAFSVNIPMAGVMRVRYSLAQGGCFAVYLAAAYPPLVEIGLTTQADGTYPILGDVSVDYVENGTFTALPDTAVADEQPTYTQYLRQDMDWWPCDEPGFGWSGTFATQAMMAGGTVLVAQGTLAPRIGPPCPIPECLPYFAIGVCHTDAPNNTFHQYGWNGEQMTLEAVQSPNPWGPWSGAGIWNHTNHPVAYCWSGYELFGLPDGFTQWLDPDIMGWGRSDTGQLSCVCIAIN